jgi:uncharacterized protein (DUF2235 family)
MLKNFTRREALTTLAVASVASKMSFAQAAKKRIVILIDGTLNDELDRTKHSIFLTNVARLDKEQLIVNGTASDGVEQKVFYSKGPTSGALGDDLVQILDGAYKRLVEQYNNGDEIYLFGFSRGAYGVRALANYISENGITKRDSDVSKVASNGPASNVHESREIACVGVWDTVASFYIPGGVGGEYIADRISQQLLKGIHDNRLPSNVKVALHAVAVDEERREFIPKFFTSQNGVKPDSARFVEQAWFPGVHSNVGGGYEDSGLAALSLAWMIARVQEQTNLEFDIEKVRKETGNANIDGTVYREYISQAVLGNLINRFDSFKYGLLPAVFSPPGRKILFKENDENNINEVVHWSVKLKYGRPCTIDSKANAKYNPPHFDPKTMAEKIIRPSEKELALLPAKVTELLPSL